MHGRQKVARSEEEEAKKQKERDKKVAAYQHAMNAIFSKRGKDELDEEMMGITGQVLAANPDITTLWNIRKATLTRFMNADMDNFKEKVVPKELDFTEFCLKANPKSYGAWFHRHWIMKQINFERADEEFKLCSKYLEYDDRNFHGWDYRRFLLDNSSLVTAEEELDFTTEKISSNFSNFSSWHLRSKLLSRLSTDYLNAELELVRNAVFTDPKDQSAWLYHSWLLRTQIPTESAKAVFMMRRNSTLVVAFNIKVSDPSVLGIDISGDGLKFSSWNNPWGGSRSKLWVINVAAAEDKDLTVSSKYFAEDFGHDEVVVSSDSLLNHFPTYFDDETKPKPMAFESLLREELSWVIELRDLEPDIKWPVLTSITLMRLINCQEFEKEILESLETLAKLDPKRGHYHNDLRSKLIVESKLRNLSDSNSDRISLKSLNLTALYYPERLCSFREVDCSDNKLSICSPISAFQSCEVLDLSSNMISSKLDVEKCVLTLPYLKSLRIDHNPVVDTELKSDLWTEQFGNIQINP